MSSLNVVALISGGKDSLYSVLHCLKNGHRVVALGNLHPPEVEVQELDSFMYQTVGHNIVHLISQALELPLYRQAIIGSALSTSRTYDGVPAEQQKVDEVESMHTVLSRIKAKHPEVNAVCTGAILSDYQRTRVESVAIRLGLVPLSYLWQFPFLPPYSEAALLCDMSSAGQDSRIIKVASGALNESFLWQNVADPTTIQRLSRAADRFGSLGDGSIIGEGGEYETFTVDGPSPLWKHSIVSDKEERATIVGDAGTASTLVKDAALRAKPEEPLDQALTLIRQPPMLDDEFQRIQEKVLQGQWPSQAADIGPKTFQQVQLCNGRTRSGRLIYVDNVTAPGGTAVEQTSAIMNEMLLNQAINAQRIMHTIILLRDMADFQGVNAVYGAFFDRPNPPSRVTIACGQALPEGIHVAMSFTCASEDVESMTGLHVQSRSYWAPANIGPYSQAIKLDTDSWEVTYIAGQIPLVPSSMDLIDGQRLSPQEFATQNCILSLQHLWRIGTILNVQLWTGGMAFFGRTASYANTALMVEAARNVWAEAHSEPNNKDGSDEDEDDDDMDVWDRKHGLTNAGASKPSSTYRQTIQQRVIPPFFAAEVETLPRNASVEWVSLGYTPSSHRVVLDGASFYTCSDTERSLLSGWVAVTDMKSMEAVIADAQIPKGAHCTIYTTSSLDTAVLEELQPRIIPCYQLWNEHGNKVAAVLAYTMIGHSTH